MEREKLLRGPRMEYDWAYAGLPGLGPANRWAVATVMDCPWDYEMALSSRVEEKLSEHSASGQNCCFFCFMNALSRYIDCDVCLGDVSVQGDSDQSGNPLGQELEDSVVPSGSIIFGPPQAHALVIVSKIIDSPLTGTPSPFKISQAFVVQGSSAKI